MSEWVKPDLVHSVAIEGGELHLSPAYDVLHRWQRLGFNILRYWDVDNDKMCNIAVDDGGAEFLVQEIGLFAIDRTDIFEHEHEIYLSWQADTMTEADFGLEFEPDAEPEPETPAE